MLDEPAPTLALAGLVLSALMRIELLFWALVRVWLSLEVLSEFAFDCVPIEADVLTSALISNLALVASEACTPMAKAQAITIKVGLNMMISSWVL